MRNPGPEKVKYNYPLDTQLPGSTSLNPGEADSEANSIVSPFLWIIQWWFISRAQISDVRYRSSESPTLELSWEYIIPKRWSQDVRRVQGPEMFSAPKTEWVSTCCSLYHGMGALKKKKKAQVFPIHNLYRARQIKKRLSWRTKLKLCRF